MSWYCGDCGDGPHYLNSKAEIFHLRNSVRGGEKSSADRLGDSTNEHTPLYGNKPICPRCCSPDISLVYHGELDKWNHESWYQISRFSWLGYTSLFGLGSMMALDIGNYPGAWSSTPWSPFTCQETLEASHSSVNNHAPCTSNMVVSSIAFTATATAIHHLNRNDLYQDHFVLGYMTIVIGIGLSLGKGLEGTIFQLLPSAILSAMLCSMFLHKILPLKQCITLDGESV